MFSEASFLPSFLQYPKSFVQLVNPIRFDNLVKRERKKDGREKGMAWHGMAMDRDLDQIPPLGNSIA